MFVDHIKIYAKAGDGGNGSASFRREKFVPRGGPDGGDGGKGGDIVLQVDPHTDNLRDFFYKPRHRARDGEHGGRFKKTGRSGKTVVLKVPAGTLVFKEREPCEAGGGEGEEAAGAAALGDGSAGAAHPGGGDIVEAGDGAKVEDEVADEMVDEGGRGPVADLTEVGQQFVLCKGGVGGKGNVHFKSATNQAPTETTPGVKGEEGRFFLELRQIADAGLVGFPNAGKSTLLTKLSAARPKVAAYPFTTLKPMVGVLDFSGFSRGTVADIPGLIEGAHADVGLGHAFLRHIMRCRILLFVVDMAGSEGREPSADLAALRTEISLYDEALAGQPWIIIANKMDLDGASENLVAFRLRFPKQEIIPVSAQEGDGLAALQDRLGGLIGHRPE